VKYSIVSLVRNAFSHHEQWPLAWRSPPPKKEYDVVIIGGGGHGLATAHYLAKEHGITNVAVLERAISAAAIPGAIQPSSGQITFLMPTRIFTSIR